MDKNNLLPMLLEKNSKNSTTSLQTIQKIFSLMTTPEAKETTSKGFKALAKGLKKIANKKPIYIHYRNKDTIDKKNKVIKRNKKFRAILF